jgi:hypothetical protein
MATKTFPGFKKLVVETSRWAIAGALFGVFFGAVASIFQGGPSALQGIEESAPWFSIFGLVAGLILSFERE